MSARNSSPTGSEPDLIINGFPLTGVKAASGVGTYTSALVEALLSHPRRPSFKVVVPGEFKCALRAWPEDIVEAVEISCPVPPQRPLFHEMWWQNRIVAHAVSKYPDAVFHSPMWCLALRQSRRMMITIHDVLYRIYPPANGGGIRQLMWKSYMRLTEVFARLAQIVLTDSQYSADQLSTVLKIKRSRIKVLYPWPRWSGGTPARSVLDAVRAKYQLPDKFWLYVGGYHRRKDVETLINAYSEAGKATMVPPLVLVGNVPLCRSPDFCDVRGTLERLDMEKDRVRLIGHVADQDLPAIYSLADLLVYPSRAEGFGLPPAEAMAAGTPVLVADATSLPEVVREAHCRFPAGSVRGLAEKLVEASSKPCTFLATAPAALARESCLESYLDIVASLLPSSRSKWSRRAGQ